MRTRETYLQRAARRSMRHRWFAWRPVRLADGRRAWLEYVLRHWTGSDAGYWVYESIDDEKF